MRRKPQEPQQGSNWMDTYGDMVTLLLTFFVLLFSMSTVNAQKWEQMASALSSDSKTKQQSVQSSSDEGKKEEGDTQGEKSGTEQNKVTEFNDLYEHMKGYVENNGLQGNVKLSKGDGYTFITFENNIFFKGDSSFLQPEGKKIIDFIASAMAQIPNKIGEVRFYGHTAQITRDHTTDPAFDWQLSVDRSTNVLLYFQAKNILDPVKLSVQAFGEYRPLYPPDGTEATRKKNRRVEIYIIEAGKEKDQIPVDQIYEKMNEEEKKNSSSKQ